MSGERRLTAAGALRGLFRRDRVTGQIAIGLVGVLVVTAAVYGIGVASAKYEISDIGAWLTSKKTKVVVHANGLAGKVDGKAPLIPGMVGHDIKVVQDGNTVLLIDKSTGVVSRIDPTQLKVAQSRQLGVGLQVVAGRDTAYTVDSIKGSVQQIDPVTLSAVGQPGRLTAPLGQAGIDGRGVLWVPSPQTGQAVPFQGGRQLQPVPVGKAGDRLAFSVAAGVPVVVNSSEAAALIIRPNGAQKVALPSTVTGAARQGGVQVPPVTEAQTVPMLGPKGSLILLDTGVGGVRSHTLRMRHHRYQAPNILGPRVYIPDQTTGRLVIFNTSTNKFEKEIQVTRPGGAIDVVVKDQMLWINDPNGPYAFAFDPSGRTRRIKKYDDKVPGGPRKPIPTTGVPNGDRGNQNNGLGRGDNGGSNGAGAPPQRPTAPPSTPPPWEAPTEPQNVVAEGGNGTIKVSFGPSAGGTPLKYVLKGQTAGFSIQPKEIAASGPDYTFTLKGGSCDREYTYMVAVQYKDKNGRQSEKLSAETQPTRPCTAPGAPTNFTAKGVNRGAELRWSAAEGKSVTYSLTGQNAPGTVAGTSHNVTGLTNNRQYPYTLRAKNAAGENASALNATADLAYQTKNFNNQNNDETNTLIRGGPNTSSATTGRIPQHEIISMTVECQVRGESYHDNQSNTTSTVWNKVQTKYGNGYLNDTLVATPKGQFPAGGLFEC